MKVREIDGLRMCWGNSGSQDLLVDWAWSEGKEGSPGRCEPVGGEGAVYWEGTCFRVEIRIPFGLC